MIVIQFNRQHTLSLSTTHRYSAGSMEVFTIPINSYHIWFLSLSDCDGKANVMALMSFVFSRFVVLKTPIFSETVTRINAKFPEKIAVNQNSRPFFFQAYLFYMFSAEVLAKCTYRNFEISNLIFFKKIEIFFNAGPYGGENFKTWLLLQICRFFKIFFYTLPMTVVTKVINIIIFWNSI